MASFSNFKSTIVQASQTAAGVASGVTVYADTDALPYVGNSDGDQAFVASNNRLYIWQGSGWYNVALINRAPSISSVQDSDGNTTPFTLSSEGAVTRITITAADSDGDLITYSATADSDFNGLASITNAGNEFTITPFSSDSATAESGTITFKATDGVNIASSGVQTFTLTFLSALWSDVVLSIGMADSDGLDNSTFIDRSTNAHTVTPTGSPVQTAFHPYLDNWSVEFDASHYLDIAHDASQEFGSNDFTIEWWMNPQTSPGTNVALLDKGWGGSNYGSILVYTGTSENYLFYASQSGSLWNVASAFDTGWTKWTNEWKHCAITRSGDAFSFYLNGKKTAGLTDSSALVSSGDPITLNGGNGGNSPHTNTYWSNFRWIVGTALYTGGSVSDQVFTPPTDVLTAVTNTKVLTCQSNRFIDTSSNGSSITPSSGAKISAFNPFGQESEYAVGENKGSTFSSDGTDYLSAPQIDLGVGDFTIECWHYSRSRINTRNSIWSNYSSYTSGALGLFAGHSSGTTTAYQVSYNGGSFPGGGLQGGTIIYNQWNHIAVVRSSGTMDLYVNGVSVASKTLTADLGGVGSNFIINSPGDNLQAGIDGYISDFNITVGTDRYTTDFTPPTAPVGNSSASLYLPMDNAGIFDKTGNATLVPNSSTATSTTQTKYATTSINFPSQSTLSVLYGSWMALSDNDFTMEMWVYPTDSSGGVLWSFGYSADNRLDFGWQASGGIRLLIETANTSNTVFTSTDAVSTYLNSWVHIAVVRSGTGFTLYVNGTSTATGTSSLSIIEDTTDGWTFGGREFSSDYSGGNLSDPFAGYLENIQFFKTAKYTSNFTVPSREQGRTYQAED